MDNLNLITSDFVFSGNFDGCLPQKVGVSAPVLKRNGPVGTVLGGKNGGDWLYCWTKDRHCCLHTRLRCYEGVHIGAYPCSVSAAVPTENRHFLTVL